MNVKKSFNKSSIFAVTLLICFLFFGNSTSFAGETYYVSPSGNTSWPQCSNIDTPCSAVTAMANAAAGDTVYFRGGTYMLPYNDGSDGYTPALGPANSGAEGNPITFIAYPGEVPFMDDSLNEGIAGVGGFGVKDMDYIIWDGFHTKAVGNRYYMSKAVLLTNANHCTIRNCVIEGLLNGESNSSCLRVEHAWYTLIENNVMWNSTGQINAGGIMSYDMQHSIIRNNTIYNTDTAIYDKNKGNYNEYYNNYIYDSVRGILMNIKWETCYNQIVHDNILRNIGPAWSIVIQGGGDQNGTAYDFLLYNNTIYGSENGIATDTPQVYRTEIFNNLVVNTGAPFYVPTGTYSYYDNNATTANFVNAGGSNPEDYKRTSYPTDGRGGAYPYVMGAYITGNEVIGYSVDNISLPPVTPVQSPQEFKLALGQ